VTTTPTTRPEAWTRFRIGAFTCTVVSDGLMEMGPARTNFPDADPAEVDALLEDHYLSPDNVVLNQNLLIVDTGQILVLFDTGVGINAEFGRKTFGSQTGLALTNMRAAGIDPADIDVIAITHAHPDHCWGLIDDEGNKLYPNARVAVSREDFDYWTDLTHAETALSRAEANHFIGAHLNLLAYEEGMIEVSDGTEIAPGIIGLAAPGHSPGHVIYRIESEGDVLICWGDLCHHQVLLLQRPEWSFQFDHDRSAATAQRLRIYDWVVSNHYEVLAFHFPFPGRGHLRRQGGQAYQWLPSELEFQLPPGVVLGIPADSPLRANSEGEVDRSDDAVGNVR